MPGEHALLMQRLPEEPLLVVVPLFDGNEGEHDSVVWLTGRNHEREGRDAVISRREDPTELQGGLPARFDSSSSISGDSEGTVKQAAHQSCVVWLASLEI